MAFEEGETRLWHTGVSDVSLSVGRDYGFRVLAHLPFEAPHEIVGSYVDAGIAGLRRSDLVLSAAVRCKMGADETAVATADSLVVYTFCGKNGLGVVAALRDGFSVADRERWKQLVGMYPRLPSSPDMVHSWLLKPVAVKSRQVLHWADKTAETFDAMPKSISAFHGINMRDNLPHANFEIEGALRQIAAGYQVLTNEAWVETITGEGDLLKASEIVPELGNGVFSVSVMWLPNELGSQPEADFVQGTLGVLGVGICRSLADVFKKVQIDGMEFLFTADANRYVDGLWADLSGKYSEIREYAGDRIYGKINQIYAANNLKGVGLSQLALTQEETVSAVTKMGVQLSVIGATDGAYCRTRDMRRMINDMGRMFTEAADDITFKNWSGLGSKLNGEDDGMIYRLYLEH